MGDVLVIDEAFLTVILALLTRQIMKTGRYYSPIICVSLYSLKEIEFKSHDVRSGYLCVLAIASV